MIQKNVALIKIVNENILLPCVSADGVIGQGGGLLRLEGQRWSAGDCDGR
jgi:hypothetical protein